YRSRTDGDNFMAERSIQEIREELERLMLKQVDMLKKQAFAGLTEKELREQDQLLKQIRETSADYLAALKNITE
ncbi:MAG: hypothetical protein WBD45_08040, partial [Terriglobales bacterium]